MRPRYKKSSEKGQVLLLVVLASVIALTVGLAAVSRSITSTRISTEESNSQKALAAAEAGIEEQINKALNTAIGEKPGDSEGRLGNNSTFLATAAPLGGDSFALNSGNLIDPDDGADIWLSNYPDYSNPKSPQLTIHWVTSGNCNNDPAIEIVIIYGDMDNPSMSRYAVDTCESSRNNNFDPPDSTTITTIDKIDFNNSYSIPPIANGRIARVIPLYNGAQVAVTSSVTLPTQGYTIESTGSSVDTVRKVQVSQPFPELPIEFFPYNLFLP